MDGGAWLSTLLNIALAVSTLSGTIRHPVLSTLSTRPEKGSLTVFKNLPTTLLTRPDFTNRGHAVPHQPLSADDRNSVQLFALANPQRANSPS